MFKRADQNFMGKADFNSKEKLVRTQFREEYRRAQQAPTVFERIFLAALTKFDEAILNASSGCSYLYKNNFSQVVPVVCSYRTAPCQTLWKHTQQPPGRNGQHRENSP